jgi:hypothetical protein
VFNKYNLGCECSSACNTKFDILTEEEDTHVQRAFELGSDKSVIVAKECPTPVPQEWVPYLEGQNFRVYLRASEPSE